jgi:hypothetical protein
MTKGNYLILPPHKNVLAGRPVTSTAGVPDPEYKLSWLTDQRPAFPIRYPTGAWGVSVALAAAAPVQLVVLANTSLNAPVTVGGAPGTIQPGALGENGIRFNPFLLLDSPVSTATLTLAGTNTSQTLIGEAMAGVPFELPAFQLADAQDEFFDLAEANLLGEYLSIPQYDKSTEFRGFSGTQVFTLSQRDAILSWWRAQRTMRLPGALVIDAASNDVRLVLVGQPKFKYKDASDLYEAQLFFLEFPRYRW